MNNHSYAAQLRSEHEMLRLIEGLLRAVKTESTVMSARS